MTDMQALATVIAATFLINLPFGYWRAGLRKLSAPWFVAIHAPVPLVVALRYGLGLSFSWVNLPFLVGAYFAGQAIGVLIARRRAAQPD